MFKHAEFSPCRAYRYLLWRRWDANKKQLFFVGLNPSTADELQDDPTIRRVVGYARAWGFGGIIMGNLFALRSTDPAVLDKAPEPVGPQNDLHLCEQTNLCALTVCGWGNRGLLHDRATEVLQMLREPHYLDLTNAGQPKHPLYLRGDLKPQPLSVRNVVRSIGGKDAATRKGR